MDRLITIYLISFTFDHPVLLYISTCQVYKSKRPTDIFQMRFCACLMLNLLNMKDPSESDIRARQSNMTL